MVTGLSVSPTDPLALLISWFSFLRLYAFLELVEKPIRLHTHPSWSHLDRFAMCHTIQSVEFYCT